MATNTNDVDYNILVPCLLSSDTMPFDITYQVLGKDGQVQGDVSAHKLILSMASTVFRSSLCSSDSIDRKAKVIQKKETTLKAFRTMIDFIYRKKVDFKQMTVHELFDLVNLAEYYMIPQLKNALNEQLDSYPVTEDTLMDIAAIAEEFTKFETASKALFTNCATLLGAVIKNVSLINFVADLAGTGNEVLGVKLISILKSIEPETTTMPEPGSLVTIDKLKIGARVTGNPAGSRQYPGSIGIHGAVTTISANGCTMRVRWDRSAYNDHYDFLIIGTNNVPNFRFS